MKIAALYARVSSAKQQLNENIASQVAAIEQYARQHDYQISPQHVYQDDGYSGARLGVVSLFLKFHTPRRKTSLLSEMRERKEQVIGVP